MPVRSGPFLTPVFRRCPLPPTIFLVVIIIFFAGFVPGCALSRAQTCQPNQPKFNVTLRAGIASGNFWNLGRAKDVDHCGELCCQHQTCNLAFSVDESCYNVECYSDELCGLRRENFTRHQVAVTLVTRSSVSHFRAMEISGKNRTKTKAKNTSGSNITSEAPNITRKDMLDQDIPINGQRDSIVTDTTINGQRHSIAPNISINGQRNSIAAEIPIKGQQHPMGPENPIKGQQYLSEVAKVNNMGKPENDARKGTPKEFKSAYFNSYENGTGFALQKAFPTKATVRLESKLVHDKGANSNKEKSGSCKARRILHKVTLRSGLKSGDFSDYGQVPDMDACVKHCCEQESCEVSLLLNTHCYTLHCYKPALCKIIPAQESKFEPQLAFVTRSADDSEEKTNTRVKKKTSTSEPDTCAHGAIFSDVTLKGGQKAGKFQLLAGGGDMRSCIKKCCADPGCQVAWLLGHHCYSVACYDKCITVKKRSSDVRSQLTLLSRKPQKTVNDKRQEIPGSQGSTDKVYTVLLNVTSQIFTEPLKDFESLEFLNLAEKIQVAVSSVFIQVPTYKGAEVASFQPAPVIAKLSLTASAATPASKLLRPLVDAVKTGELSSTIDGNPIKYDVSGAGFQFLTPGGFSLTCAPEHDYDISWKMAVFNSTDNQICPRRAQGQVNRFCAGSEKKNASWNVPDFSECVSSEYRNVHQQSKDLAERAKKKQPIAQVTSTEIITRIERLIFADTYREELLNRTLSTQNKNFAAVKKHQTVKPSKKHDVVQKQKGKKGSGKKTAHKSKKKDNSHPVPVTEIPRLKPEVLPTTGAKPEVGLNSAWSLNSKPKVSDMRPANILSSENFNQPSSAVNIPLTTTTKVKSFGNSVSAVPHVGFQDGGNLPAQRNTVPFQRSHPTFPGRRAWGGRNSVQSLQNSAQSNAANQRLNAVAINHAQFGNPSPARNVFQRTQIPYQSPNPQLAPAYARPQNPYRLPGNPAWAGGRAGAQRSWGRSYSPPSYSSDQMDIGRRKRDVDMNKRGRRQRRQSTVWYNQKQYPQQFNYASNRGSIPGTGYQQPGNAFPQNSRNTYPSLQNQAAVNSYRTNYPLSSASSYGMSPGMSTFSAGQPVAPGFNPLTRGNRGKYGTQPGIVTGGQPVAVERWPNKPTHKLQRPTLDFSKNWPTTAPVSSIGQTKTENNALRGTAQNVRTNHETTARVIIPKAGEKLLLKSSTSQNADKKEVKPAPKSGGSKKGGADNDLFKKLQDLTAPSLPRKKAQVKAHKRQNATAPRLKRSEKHLAPMFGGDMLLSVGVLQLLQQFAHFSKMVFTERILQLFVNASSHLLDLNNKREWSNAQKHAEVLYKRGINVLESNGGWDESQEIVSQDSSVGSVVLELVRTVQEYVMNASYSVSFNKPLLTKNILLAVKTFGSDSSDPTRPMSLPNYSDPLVANWSTGRDSITLTPSIFDSAVLGKSVKVHLLSSRFRTVSALVPDSTGNNSGLVLNSAVISSTARPAVTEELVPPVTIVMSVLNASLNKFQQECVAWSRQEGQGNGKWSSKGCTLRGLNDTHATCECNHMTDFAVLADTNKEKGVETPHPSAAVPSGGSTRDRSWIGWLLGILVLLLLIILVLVLLFVWRRRKKSQDQEETPRSRSRGPSGRSRSLSRSSSRPSRSVSSKSDGAASPASSHSSQFDEMIAARRRRMAMDKQQKAELGQDEDEDDLLMKEKAMLFSDYHQPYHFLSKEEQDRADAGEGQQPGTSRASPPRRDRRSAMEQDGSDV